MKISAITLDQIIVVGGVPAFMMEVGGYQMERGEWAVQFDTDSGVGHVEYTDNRDNQIITQADFDAHYSWLIDEHANYLTFKEAELEQQNASSSGSTGGNDATDA